MKKIHNLLFVVLLVLTIPFASVAQDPPPPDGTPSGGSTGSNAPIGSGLVVLLSLGAVYGGKKVYQLMKEDEK